ncbi:hypothetical protein [Desulfoluna spongiiphila]|uniref:Uncharacterized protein n=1 Tax=Desulfoluna spongiiphila TaxID=419481 RepID=A0A1G5FZ69_9BACT|nr:hypothetical protein [Desulfoluna spongiiphila]SCY44397.1 hypothetical protein SAMN05216233_10991 [Desulfoluna spongiiphila]
MKQRKKPKESYIAIKEIAFNLGLIDSDVEEWLSMEQPEIKIDHRQRQKVSSRYLELLSRKTEYEYAKRKSLESENILRKKEVGKRKEYLKAERIRLLKIYEGYISDLETLHKNCLERANNHHHESCIIAAYLLFSKVISCLKMGCLNIEHGYWYGGSVIREIDESLDLATYFMISYNSEEGKTHLHKWFRHNRAPQHLVCRKAISRYMSNLLSEIDMQDHQDLMNELYQSKSKWTHPTYSSIREVTQFNTDSGINISKVEYGSITFETKLYELTHFFRSSIWSSFQVFQICFSSNLPLTEDEDIFIKQYDDTFKEWDKVNW